MVFSNFLIGLREGLEASLIVGILVAYLVKIERHDALRALWIGVGVAVGASLAFAGFLVLTANELSEKAEEAFAGIMSIIAVVFVTWMIFWMRRAAREMKHELHGRLDRALVVGTTAIAVTAAVAVGREGLETALFLWTNAKATGTSWQPIVGGVLGIAAAIVLGYLIYRRAVSINLATFFAWTGAALVVIAAGVLAYGLHDLQEAGFITFGTATAYDISGWYSETSWYGTLLKGIFHFSADATVLEVVAWFGYLVPTMTLFLVGLRAPKPAAESVTDVAAAEATSSAGSPAVAGGGR